MRLRVILFAVSSTGALWAESPDVLPLVTVHSPRVANQAPVATFAMPVSALRFEPRVDVQARNFAEGQADVAIRGGTFENTGFRLGAVALYDPQTGHYFAELPIASAMLGAPAIATGADLALQGWNATAGSISYGWQPIRSRGFVSAGGGDGDLIRGELYAGAVTESTVGGGAIFGADVALAASRADGLRPAGDHEFVRYNARVQLRQGNAQTDVFAGYQSKFFGWPQLYAGPFVSDETENLKTTLFLLNHRAAIGADGDFVEFGAYYRKNVDDYEFSRIPPADTFLHTTRVRGAGLDGLFHVAESTALRFRAGVIADELTSLALTFPPPYRGRTQTYAGVFGEHELALAAGRQLLVIAGANYDDSDRNDSAASPVIAAEWRQRGGFWRSVRLSYSEATQLPTYTALKSNPLGGLFRGNPNLGRSTARNLELGTRWQAGEWVGEATVFYRWDEDLVDWTYSYATSSSRTANAVDLETAGLEIGARRNFGRVDLVLGYTALYRKDNYGPGIDASFYALNYARHRLTAALIARITDEFELRWDNEFRVQADNALRRSSDEAAISSVGVYYRVPRVPGLSLSVQIDNLWNSSFEEVPLVPGTPRQIAFGAAYAW